MYQNNLMIYIIIFSVFLEESLLTYPKNCLTWYIVLKISKHLRVFALFVPLETFSLRFQFYNSIFQCVSISGELDFVFLQNLIRGIAAAFFLSPPPLLHLEKLDAISSLYLQSYKGSSAVSWHHFCMPDILIVKETCYHLSDFTRGILSIPYCFWL